MKIRSIHKLRLGLCHGVATISQPQNQDYSKLEKPFSQTVQHPLHAASVFHEGQVSAVIKPHIVDIPTEILDRILEYLPVADQVCFALSSKHLYAHFRSFLQAQGRSLPELLREERPILIRNVDIESRARTQVLRRLEKNSGWEFCPGCWKLHPRSAARRTPKKSHCLECQFLLHGQQGWCLPSAGVVDLCPCLSITFRDQADLMKTLESVQDRVHAGREFYYNRLFSHPSFGKKRSCLWHQCSITDHPYGSVDIETGIWISVEQCLVVENRYTFCINRSSRTSPSGVNYPSICPHKDTKKWLQQFFLDAGLSFKGWHNVTFISRAAFWLKRESAELHQFKVRVTRILGQGKWPDKLWERSRRHD